MIHFGLNDLKETPLKELANQLGVPNASTLTAVDAIREIKNKLAPQSALVFVPMLPGDSGRAWKTATGVSIISLCIALAAAAAAWLATVAAINKNTAEQREKEELAWQTTIVYKIIDDASKTESSGIPFSDISIKYVSEATSAE